MTESDAAKAVVRRNTEEVQSKGDFDVFEELFSDDFVDHATQPGATPDKATLHLHADGVSGLSCEDSLAAHGMAIA